jgi:hypothetical protein
VFLAAQGFGPDQVGLERCRRRRAPCRPELPRRRALHIQLLEALLDLGGVDEADFGTRQADLGHRGAEQVAILGLVDGLGLRADHLDVVALQHAHC